MTIKNIDAIGVLCSIGVMLGTFWSGMSGLLKALLLFILIDYLTGISVGIKSHKINSYIGWIGLLKKAAIIACIVVGHVLDVWVLNASQSPCCTMVIFFYLANEGVSILENIGNLGVPIPDRLKDIIEDLKKEG